MVDVPSRHMYTVSTLPCYTNIIVYRVPNRESLSRGNTVNLRLTRPAMKFDKHASPNESDPFDGAHLNEKDAPSTTYTQRQGVRQPSSSSRSGVRLGGARSTNIRGVTKGGSSDCAV